MDNNETTALEWLLRFDFFWQVCGRFYKLAFNLEEGESDPCAARLIPDAPEFLSLNPVMAKGLWVRAMQEVGGGLSKQAAIELMNMGREDRLAQAEAAANTLGLTAAGRQRFARFIELEIEGLGMPDFWDWVRRERVAEGLE